MAMRCVWVDYLPSDQLHRLRAKAAELFGVAADVSAGHSTGPAHCSFVYDNAGSEWTDERTCSRILTTWPEVLTRHCVTGLALVHTEGPMPRWRVVETHKLT